MADGVDSFFPHQAWDRHRSTPVLAGYKSPMATTPEEYPESKSVTSLSPKSRISRKRPDNLALRLRSNSGLDLHTDQSALRQYIDYNTDGSPRSANFGPGIWRTQTMSSIDDLASRSGSGLGWYSRDGSPPLTPPAPDFFSRDAIEMVLSSPLTAERLLKFAQCRAAGVDVEFLLKVQEYTAALNSLTGLMTHISGAYATSLSPLQLPGHLAPGMNADLKRFFKAVLPGMERLFVPAKSAIEDRMGRDTYPAFVKRQLMLYTRAQLSLCGPPGETARWSLPGLGTSFCLTDAMKPGNPIAFVSESFTEVTGYSQREAVGQSLELLQDGNSNSEAHHRIQRAIEAGEEVTEVITNYHQDGRTFCSLLFVCPLEEQGKPRHYLAGQMNISEAVSSKKDLLRILSFGPMPGEVDAAIERPLVAARSDRRGSHATDHHVTDRHTDTESGESRKGIHKSHSRRRSRGFFKSFAKRTPAPSPAPSVRPRTSSDEQISCTRSNTPFQATSPYLSPPKLSEPPPPYASLLVLRYIPTWGRPQQPEKKGSSPITPRLPIMFASTSALELLGIHPHDRDAILHRDVFTVLTEHASSPSVGKTVKALLREKIRVGEPQTLELVVGNRQSSGSGGGADDTRVPLRPRKSSIMSMGLAGKSESAILASEGPRRKSQSLERAEERATGKASARTLVSHWTPLKDGDGRIGWVVVVLVPASL